MIPQNVSNCASRHFPEWSNPELKSAKVRARTSSYDLLSAANPQERARPCAGF
jgi:hypothetical protein